MLEHNHNNNTMRNGNKYPNAGYNLLLWFS